MSEELEIPDGWVKTTLENVVKKVNLKVSPIDHPNAKFIGMDCIQPNSMVVAFHYSFGEFKSSGNWFNENDVLYGRMRPYLNKVFKATYNGACSGEFIVLSCENFFYPDYLAFLLHSRHFVEFANSKTSGDRPRISFNEISSYPLLLPPLAEQHRIVARIEELFSSLDKGIEALKTAQQQLKVYRQAVLKWAFEGRLTNPNLQEGELPEGWVVKRIEEVCDNIKVGIVVKPSEFYSKGEKGIKAFRSANVREFRVNDNDWVYFSEEANELNNRTKVYTGDVLIVRSGYPGTSCVVPDKYSGCNAIDILIAKPNSKLINPDFLCAFNNSPLGKGLFAEKSRGVAQKHLNVGEYSKLKIFIPSIQDQRLILDEIESRLSVCDKIEENIAQSLYQAEALRQSILKKAFEGKLVPQDPSDEPASVLLERIKANKEKIKPENAVRKKKSK